MADGSDLPDGPFGVHSEVGRLRRVLVCAPGLAHERLTPSNCDELLFDDVLWVERAREDHADFCDEMRTRGIEVVELHHVLTETVAIPEARAWLLDRKIVADEVGLGLVDETRAFLDELPDADLARFLVGGLSAQDLPADLRPGDLDLARDATGITEYLMPPLPNMLYARDTTAVVHGGVLLHPLHWPARQDETLLMKAVYGFHPDFVDAEVWWGDPERSWGLASIEGGDVLVAGGGVVIIGMGERTTRQAITQVAAELFARGAVEQVIVARIPRQRSAMHLDTVFTFADRDVATAYPGIVDGIQAFTLRPSGDPDDVEITKESAPFVDVVARALGLTELRIVENGGSLYDGERQQWDSGNNLLALEPGVVVAYDRNTHTNALLRKAGVEVITIPGAESAVAEAVAAA